ncbi:MAG: hypothetical protein HC897_19810 [Thermoanaerobaculia bacterium]|nr:hypothetical protein [Thermoanaerobaculia bacterium]
MAMQPYRLAVGSSGAFFVMFALTNDRLFGRFDATNTLLGSFGTFLQDQGVNAMLLDGWIEPDGQDGLVYAARYAGLVAAYDALGGLRFVAETIDRPPLPSMVKSSGRIWVDREAPTTAFSLSVTPEGIHVLTATPEGLKQRGVIDTYSLDDGRYLFSRRLPEACRSAKVTTTHLYTIGDTSITQWSLRDG